MPTSVPDATLNEIKLAAEYNISVAQLRTSIPRTATVANLVANYMAAASERTRHTYGDHFKRMLRVVGPVCDQLCEPCLKRHRLIENSRAVDFLCACDCRACLESRITIPPRAELNVGPAVLDRDLTVMLAEVARRYAVKSGVLDNRKRALRGLPAKKAHGRNAHETAISAMRSLLKSNASPTPTCRTALWAR